MAHASKLSLATLTITAAVVVAAMTSVSAIASASVPTAEAPGVIAAKKVVGFLSTYPTKIPISVPLTKRPPKGIKVFYISAATADAKRTADGFAAAAAALGWQATQMTFPSNTADSVGLVQQAIQQGATYIGYLGVDTKVIQPALDAARAANVPMFANSTDAVAGGRANWIFASVNPAVEFVNRGQVAADVVTANSSGKANTLLFNVPQFAIYSVWANAFKEEYAKNCRGCKLDELNAPVADIFNGKASSAVVAYLRSHPEINQIACVNGSWCADFPSKAATAEVNISNSGVGLTMSGTGTANLPMIVAKTIQSSIAAPLEYSGWQVVDAMARQSVGNSLVPNWKARQPLYLWTQRNTTAGSQMYAGPTNYTGQFKKLWKVN